jgi:hypothetical protein
MMRAVTMTRRWLVWFPVLMVGSLLYWTVALGLGGMSLMAVSAMSAGAQGLGSEGVGAVIGGGGGLGEADTAQAMPPRDGYEPIIVRLEESVEPEDVDDNAGCGLSPGAFPTGEADVTPAPVSHSSSSLVVSY